MAEQFYRGLAMTIASSDSGGGAGIQADLKTFAALRVFGTSALVAVTVQNSLGVSGFHVLPPQVIEGQITAVGTDFKVGAAKIGMIGSAAAAEAVAAGLASITVPWVVLDPVMVATSGDSLIEDDAVAAIIRRLLPLASIVTPNLPEAERLTGISIGGRDDMERAARALIGMGASAALIKGGHMKGESITDLLLTEEGTEVLTDARIDSGGHGTGCTLSSAIAAELAAGTDLPLAVSRARRYLRAGLMHGVKAGQGIGCLGHALRMDWIEDVTA